MLIERGNFLSPILAEHKQLEARSEREMKFEYLIQTRGGGGGGGRTKKESDREERCMHVTILHGQIHSPQTG